MSFVRLGRPQQHSKGKRPVRPRKTTTTTTTAARREWVSTVNDLSVHKLTPAELNHRHEIHKSHNKAAAQWELREKALRRRLRHPGSPAPLDPASLSIIREVFSDQLLLQDVLARSDRAMAVVKDLFGDAPRRQTGHPSVTMAPNCDSDSELPVLQRPDPPTQLSLLSQSMMDQQALNEVEVPEKDCSDEDTSPTGSSNHHVIKRANIRRMKAQSSTRVTQQHKVQHPNSDQAENDHFPVTPCTSGRAPDTAALNATVAVQRVRPRQSPPEEGRGEPSVLVSQVLNPEPPNQSGRISRRIQKSSKFVSHSSVLDGSSVASLSGDQSGLGLLQSMLGQVEADLDTLMSDTEPASAQSQKSHSKQGLTGFSVALVSTLGRLVHLHQQREEEAQREAQERRRLEQELREQCGLIDALTAETMTLREEFGAQQAGLQQRTEELEQKLDTLVLVMGGLGLLEDHIDLQYSDVNAAAPQSAHVAERESASPAVLLSPPRQRDNWQQIPAHPVLSHHGPPPVDFLPEDVKAHRLTSSLSSLPLTSLPSSSSLSLTSDPDGPQLSPQAILAEIAQLSRQNDMIKAQLSQARGLGSVERGSPQSSSSVNGLRRLSSSCSGRVTPESVGERRMSASSSTGQKSQTKGEQPADQVSSPNTLSVNSVEQRLLELNRQSAAARGRLLELIEQQKQTVSVKVSPSHSPIPPSAFSPYSAGGSPELLSTQKPLPLAGDGERRSAGSVSPLSLEEDRRDGKTQIKKHKEKEGWFSLSAHVR